MRKLAYIDALRGIAILLVILGHCTQFGTNNYGHFLKLFLGKCEYGVQLFYIASAFTLFLSFNNRIKKENSPYLNFFIRRFFRIAPMFYTAVIFYLVHGNSWTDNVPISIYSKVVPQFLLINGFSPYWMSSVVPGGWSVGLEMSFYMLIPFLFTKIKNLNSALLFFLISVFLQYLLKLYFVQFPLISNASLWSRFLYCYLPSQLPVFTMGIVLFHLLTGEIRNFKINPINFFLLFLIIGLQFWLELEILPNFILVSIGLLFLSIALFKLNESIFTNVVICFIGKISFSLYLIHFAVLELLIDNHQTDFMINNHHYTINLIIRFAVVLIISIIVSTITYYSIEKPMQKIGARIISKLEKV